MYAVLKRFDPDEHIDRWYSVAVQPTLFEPVAVICAWGSRQNSWQQMKIIPAGDMETAVNLARRIVK